MTTILPVAYKARLAGEQSYTTPTFEINSIQLDQLIADCPIVEKLFSKYGGTYTIPHSNRNLRTAVKQLDRIRQNYVGVKHDGKFDVVRKGPQLEELAEDESYEVVPLENDYLFLGDGFNLRKFLTYVMGRKQDFSVTVDGPSAPAGTPKYQKQFHKKRIGKK